MLFFGVSFLLTKLCVRLRKSTHHRGLHGSVKLKQMYEHLKENGDLNRPMDTADKKDLKQGEIDFKAIQQKKQQAELTR